MKGKDLEHIIREAQQHFEKRARWLKNWRKHILSFPKLPREYWLEDRLVHKLPLPRLDESTQVSAVDGGLVAEELRGFDLALSRAIAVTFRGVGNKVEVDYYPSFDPAPNSYIRSSFTTRQEFSKFTTLIRLLGEYQIATGCIEKNEPEVLFLDGSVTPLVTDLTVDTRNSDLHELQQKVMSTYLSMLEVSEKVGTLVMGVIKDSRSRQFSKLIERTIVQWGEKVADPRSLQMYLGEVLDFELATAVLSEGSRTAWFRLKTPGFIGSRKAFGTMVRPLREDDAVRLEVISISDAPTKFELGLQAYYILCQHGLPLAIPTVITEADRLVKLGRLHIENAVNMVAMTLGIPLERLKKRRNFESTMTELDLDQ